MPAVGAIVTNNRKQYPGNLTPFGMVTCIITAMAVSSSGGVTTTEPFLKKFFPSVWKKKNEDSTTNQYCQYDTTSLTMFASSLYLAAFLPSLVASTVKRKLGRKPSMFFRGVLFFAGAIINGFAKDVWMLIVGRMLLGFVIGFANQLYNITRKQIIDSAHFLLVMSLFIHKFLPETRGIPTEEMRQVWTTHWFWSRYVTKEDFRGAYGVEMGNHNTTLKQV